MTCITGSASAALYTLPVGYAILNSRKRALIALVHSVVFLGVAIRMGGQTPPPSMLLPLAALYVGITSLLLFLAWMSRPPQEKAYFGLCATSALFGLLRLAALVPPAPAYYGRVTALLVAVVTCAFICGSLE